jgi:TolB-like protein/Tfp pilus assembly protein PilF
MIDPNDFAHARLTRLLVVTNVSNCIILQTLPYADYLGGALVAANWRIQGEQDSTLAAAQGSVRISLYGEFSFAGPDGAPIALSNRRSRALMAMLALEPEQPLAREVLTKLLWPGRFESQARASLRQCLLDLGKVLVACGCPVLSVTRDQIGLVSGKVKTDLGDLLQALAVGNVEQVNTNLQGIGVKPLLDQMELGENFGSWLQTKRTEIERRIGAGVSDTVERLQRTGNAATATRLVQAWALRGGQPVAPPTDNRIRIAILPFQALNAPDGQDYFADGVVDELITTLGQVPQLRVAGRTSSFHFRNSDLAAPEIAETLRVAHLVEGSVQRQGEKVRIFVRLIDGATGFESWGQRYDGSVDDIFGLQETVARAVTAALGRQLGLNLDTPQVPSRTESREAYDLYLQGRALGARIFGDGVLDRAIALLERAVEIDPMLAEAWVELAEAHHNVSVYTQCLDKNAEAAKMAECARRAIAIAPHLGYPHALLGTYEWTRNNLVGAMDIAFDAYRREPDNPAVAMRLGSFLLYCGRTRDAEPYVRAAIDKDPVDGRKFALLWSLHMGRQELEAAQAVGQRMVDLGWPSIYLAVTSAALGQHDQAVVQYQLTRALVNTIILPPAGAGEMTEEAMTAYWLMAAKGVCSGTEADRMIYFQVLEMMFATLPDKADVAIVGPAVFTGNAELLFKALRHHITPANILSLIVLWIDIDPIRRIWQHEEFIPFAQSIGMAAVWDKYGWPDLLPPPSNRV